MQAARTPPSNRGAGGALHLPPAFFLPPARSRALTAHALGCLALAARPHSALLRLPEATAVPVQLSGAG